MVPNHARLSAAPHPDVATLNEKAQIVPLAGLEPALLAPEASALSSELQGHSSIILLPRHAFKRV